ncbi:MAG: TrkH family potassium uptake protein [Marinibacterium sp.]|nr:TrkH family potassium uptake protein [Marinibacterium sp.]
MPLILVLWGGAAGAMLVPAILAMVLGDEEQGRAFFFTALIGVIMVGLIQLATANRPIRYGTGGLLLTLLATFLLLPLYLALPVWDILGTTHYINAYFDMVSALTTTGADMVANPSRFSTPLHLWRAMVGWLGGLLMWVAASAILAPMNLGGFEVTARGGVVGRPDHAGRGRARSLSRSLEVSDRLGQSLRVLGPVYAGLTGAVCVLLLISGDDTLVALCHAMSVMATSGISPVGGLDHSASGLAGEIVLFLFMFFALSRLTFSSDTVAAGDTRIDRDPEFRVGLLIIVVIPLLIFLRHWVAVYELDASDGVGVMAQGLWGAMFTVTSFLTTTGFVSSHWDTAQSWSGLGTSELVLMGLALIGGGVATTAGGVKLLRVYALYLNGLREMERLVHPSSVSGIRGPNRRIQRDGAFIAWVFFMLFGMSIASVTILLSAYDISFENALVLAVATLSTTGPLIEVVPEADIHLAALGAGPKLILCVAMVLGRLETLAIIALLTPNVWRL